MHEITIPFHGRFVPNNKKKGMVIYMELFKPINNNIISAIDDDGREVVIIGKGLGYKATPGAKIPQEKIDKVFVMSNQDNMDRLKDLFASLPTEYIELTDEILTFAKTHLGKRLNEAAYFTLADHISFAVTRYKQGIEFQNILLQEVRRFYPKEYEVGMYALQQMKEKLDVEMPKDEAASIAMHILHAEYDISISDAVQATQLMDQILTVVANETGYVMSGASHYCERFFTHLRYLAQRVIQSEPLPKYHDDDFFKVLAVQYPKEMQCAELVSAMILQDHQYTLSKEEISRLTIHIKYIQPKTGGTD